jgi:hypothetical protein
MSAPLACGKHTRRRIRERGDVRDEAENGASVPEPAIEESVCGGLKQNLSASIKRIKGLGRAREMLGVPNQREGRPHT